MVSLRQRSFSRARHKFELMCELGTDLMLTCSSIHPAGLGGVDRCADDFRELGEIAKSYGVRVGYEALAWGGSSMTTVMPGSCPTRQP